MLISLSSLSVEGMIILDIQYLYQGGSL